MPQPVPLLDLTRQYALLRDALDEAVARVVSSQQFVLGAEVVAFETEVAEYVGVPHAVGCASGTDALILSLAALGVGPGDEVLTTPFSFFATASCAVRVGARPVFADVDPVTFNLDPERAAGAVGPKTRALVPVHLFGQCADMDPLRELAARHGLYVVEDAAQALGARYASRATGVALMAGAMGDTGCYSFFPSKNLGGFGDGGMVVTRDEALADKIRALRVHGQTGAYEHAYVGWNSRLDALQAAVLRVKLPHLDAWSEARRGHAERYDHWFRQTGLVDRGAVSLPARPQGPLHIVNQYTLRVRERDALRLHLQDRGIGHAVYYPVPLHLQPCFRDLGHEPGDFPVAERLAGEVISLPVFPELREDEQERVVAAVADFYASR